MTSNYENDMFFKRKPYKTKPFDPRKCSRKKNSSRDLYRTLNRFMWFHGIGFEKGMNCTRKHAISTAVSLFLVLLFEGRATLMSIYMLLDLGDRNRDRRETIASVAIMLINCLNRVLIYIKRREFKEIMQRLANVYKDLGENRMLLRKFTWKLKFILLTNDFFIFCSLIHFHFSFILKLPATFRLFGFIPPPFSIPGQYVSLTLYYVSFCQGAVTAYFCSVCFLIKESLTALNKRFQHSKDEDLEHLFHVHCEISAEVSSTNKTLHPNLFLSVSITLFLVFRNIYLMLFSHHLEELTGIIFLLSTLTFFLQFVCLCIFGSYVINASADVEATAQKSLVRFFQQRSRDIVTAMKKTVGGFQIFNSITIEKSLILSAIASLLTYGILFATFNTSKNSNGG